ncbi:MAG: hypothetical protein ACRD2Z_13670 [Thermoanaerobaculia bacterium]
MQVPPAPTLPAPTGDQTQDTQNAMKFQQEMNTWQVIVNAMQKGEEKRAEALSGAINRAVANIR